MAWSRTFGYFKQNNKGLVSAHLRHCFLLHHLPQFLLLVLILLEHEGYHFVANVVDCVNDHVSLGSSPVILASQVEP